jgi:hypothetical protein
MASKRDQLESEVECYLREQVEKVGGSVLNSFLTSPVDSLIESSCFHMVCSCGWRQSVLSVGISTPHRTYST